MNDADLDAQFNHFAPQPIKYTANLAHLFADYVEILSVLQAGDSFSAADLIKRFEGEGVTVPNVSTTIAGPPGSTETPAEKDDRYDAWAQQVFLQLEYRSSLFGDDYPFVIDGDGISAKAMSQRQKIYLMLLLCSNLHFLTDVARSVLTSDFEQVSYEALTSYLPDNAEVKQLGKNSDYKGTAYKKLSCLASDMNLNVDDHELGKVQGTQERGCDIVGWLPTRDGHGNHLSLFGQCACGKEWYSKLSETRRFDGSYFRFKLKPIHVLFVPRNLFFSDDLYQSDEVNEVLLFERSRILEHITSLEFADQLDSISIVDRFIATTEALV